jgi:hypothetical protein
LQVFDSLTATRLSTPETCTNQVAFEVIGNDVTISFAAEAGQLQLNAFEPVIAYSLISLKPARGPLESRRRSLQVFDSLTATRLSTPETSTR